MRSQGKLVPYSVTLEKSIFSMGPSEVFSRAGEDYIFTRMKQGNKSYVATKINDNQSYSIRVWGTTSFKVKGLWEKKVGLNDTDKLSKGDLFAINYKGKDALLFEFVEFTRSGKIKGRNPFTKVIFTLDKSFEPRLIENIKS